MHTPKNHERETLHLQNLKNRELKLRTMRSQILNSPAEKALDIILDAPSPASLVQSFPDQDLYYLLHKIGGHDFLPVLKLARSDQWEYILDVEVWDNDRLDINGMTKTFDLLFQADPQRLLRWAITTKPDFFEFYLMKHIQIRVREHDEPTPDDHNDYITFDDKFYFRLPDIPENSDKTTGIHPRELIEKMLDLVARMDISVFHGLMLETLSLLPAEVEEEQFRLKNIRLAEKGFLPTHEAVGIYQPLAFSDIRKRIEPLEKTTDVFDPQMPLPPQFISQVMPGDNLLTSALEQFDPHVFLILESEFAALVNKVISADKIKLTSRQDMEKAVQKANHYLNLGLEIMTRKQSPSPSQTGDQMKDVINHYFLEDVFRTGARQILNLCNTAAKWFQESCIHKKRLPISFLGETYLGTLGGLFLDRPLFYDNYQTGTLYRDFSSISDIDITEDVLKQVQQIDQFLSYIDVDLTSFEEGVLTYKSLILTLWARHRLELASTLKPIHTTNFKPFFKQMIKSSSTAADHPAVKDLELWAASLMDMDSQALPDRLKTIFQALIEEVLEEYASVSPEDLDPKFVLHFFLKA